MKKIYFFSILIFLFACRSNTNKIITSKNDSSKTQKVTVVLTNNNSDTTVSLKESFYKHFVGKIGNDEAILDIVSNRKKIIGMYYKLPDGKQTGFSGNLTSDHSFLLTEMAVQGKKTLIFSGKFKNTKTISGKYDNNLDFNFIEDYTQSAAFDVFFISATDSVNENTYSTDNITFYYPHGIINNQTTTDSIKIKFSEIYFSEKSAIENAENYVKNYNSSFNAEYDKTLKQGEASMPWDREIIGDIVFNQNNYLTFALHTNSFSGGAHGNYSDNFYVFDLISGKEIKTEDILNLSSSDKLSKIIYDKIKENRKISDSEMKEIFETQPLPVSSNFYINQAGVGFCYNPYQITAYVNGSDDVLIPYSEIKNLLKSDFVNRMKLY